MIKKSILSACICLIALAACNLQDPNATQTSGVSETQSIATAFPEATLTLAPDTPLPPTAAVPTVLANTVVPPTARPATAVPATAVPPTKAGTAAPTKVTTAAPTLAPTSASSGMPQVPEVIQILAPGVGSAIISAVTISGVADPTFEQHLVAKVTGENGLSVGMKATTIQSEVSKRGPFSVGVPFNVTHDQPGRVAVWSSSAKDGGIVHFSSIEVNLKTSGAAQILTGQPQVEPLVITSPAAGAEFSGGKLHLEGWAAPVFENTIVVVLCGEGGTGKSEPFCGTVDNVLARLSTTIKAPDVGKAGPFSLDVTFKVTRPLSGRVAVYTTSPRDGGLLHLSSVPVTLKP